jgi:hypothetical protein
MATWITNRLVDFPGRRRLKRPEAAPTLKATGATLPADGANAQSPTPSPRLRDREATGAPGERLPWTNHGVWLDRLKRSTDGWVFTSRTYQYLWIDLSPFAGDMSCPSRSSSTAMRFWPMSS